MGTLGRLNTQLAILLLGLGLVAVVPADDQQRARELRAAGDILALEEILDRLPAQQGARVVEVEIEEKGGRVIYEIERLEGEGRLREYKFDARSGELLTVEDE